MTTTFRGVALAVVAGAIAVAGLAVSSAAQRGAAGQSPLPEVTVYKDPNCGCCSQWVTHMEQAGFPVTAVNTPDMPAVRTRHGVPQHVQSCHTALVDGFVVEGHVPAGDVKRLLMNRPSVKGIAVPGMPIGSPGMEQGSVRHPYSVLTFDASGRTTVFARH